MDKNEILSLCQGRRVFPIVEDINEQMIDEMQKMLFFMALSSPTDPVYLIFNTDGGNVSKAMVGYDFLKSLKIEVIGIVVGRCDSAGLILLAGCTKGKRLSLKHSRFLFHAITSGIAIKSTENRKEGVRIFMDGHIRLCSDVANIYLAEFKMTKKVLTTITNEGEFYDRKLFTDEAKKYGVIDEIVTELPFL